MASYSPIAEYIVNIDDRINIMTTKSQRPYLTAAEAADAMGVTKATLYAYASRGQLRSEPAVGQLRERRYHREDIERLLARKEARRDPDQAAARGLHWGGPVLDSGITLIHDGKLYYRGCDVAKLAQENTLETVAELLWEAEPGERGRLFKDTALSAAQLARLKTCARQGPLILLQTTLPVAGA